jgi:hypothetical protein
VTGHAPVLPLAAIERAPLADLLGRYGLTVAQVADDQAIPGSFWGAPEAGIVGMTVYVRADTPVHSVLHEACHTICMDGSRRRALSSDAGGDYDEENAVCYLQILLAEQLPQVGAARLMADMDAWGYTFRLGSTRAWFEQETQAEQAWLRSHGLLDAKGLPTGRLRA